MAVILVVALLFLTFITVCLQVVLAHLMCKGLPVLHFHFSLPSLCATVVHFTPICVLTPTMHHYFCFKQLIVIWRNFNREGGSLNIYSHSYYFQCPLFLSVNPDFHLVSFSFCLKDSFDISYCIGLLVIQLFHIQFFFHFHFWNIFSLSEEFQAEFFFFPFNHLASLLLRRNLVRNLLSPLSLFQIGDIFNHYLFKYF